ncbi:diguanylate cyclase [Sphingomonas sp. PL-96]|uniref:GGDEF and EAL domain-containing protein n=1 Tax=Sphingomonas sp. PL-96 TaxID=2887201 RepID=UPI001E4C0C68|nr:GGDEF and EAL domain-containing protein [Sphingomonas sp. PL-96]MCC2976627.1 diguanylate cyclase [Sphingomonas sp. PL-96]
MDANSGGFPCLGNGNWDAPTAARILDLLPGLVAYFGLDLRYRYANDRYAEWRSIPGREMVGKYVREIVGERNYPLIVSKLRQAAAGEPVVYEYDIFDGEQQRRVQGSYVPDVDADRKVIGIIALVTDISVRDDLQRRIARGEAMFNEAFENAPIGNAIVDVQGHLIRSNRAFAAMLGRTLEEMTELSITDITHPDDIDADLVLFRSVLNKERDGYWLEKRYVRKDGSCLYGKLVVAAVRNDAGDAVRFLTHVEDITQQREAERRLAETNARLSLVTKAIPGGSWHLDVATSRFETSEALAQFVCGPTSATMDLARYSSRIHPEDLVTADLGPLLRGDMDRSSVEYRLETIARTRWMRCDRRLLRDAQGHPEQIVGVTIDFTEEHERRALAEGQASTDPLTGLLNRRGLDQRLRDLPQECPCGVLAIDLDGFKQVNDQLGHQAGDALLTETAYRLRAITRTMDLVARVGGDEFVVVLVGLETSALQVLAERATVRRQEHFATIAGCGHHVGASVGASWSPQPPSSAGGILARAGAALYQAKAAGRGTLRVII